MTVTKIEALNCPNCGAAVSSDKTQCIFCNSRLKTQACPKCLGLMFLGSLHCTHCGAKTVTAETAELDHAGDCPRCKKKLEALVVGEFSLQECSRCGGMWSAADVFESICTDSERQAAVLNFTARKAQINGTQDRISYVPCPNCKQLMNRSNFARSSGVIIDLCKHHGVWFDAEELPKIIEFIRAGGIETARQRERLEIKDERERLHYEQRQAAVQKPFALGDAPEDDSTLGSLIDFLFKI